MRKTYKKIIALCAVLIFALALIPVQSFALGDPFTAIAVGGLSGASGAGLFGSMASANGFDISFPSGTSSDPADALWNKLNPDNVYFSGEKGQVTEPDPITGTPTVYDYINVDISDWLQAQNDFIDEFVSNYNVIDNSSGNITINRSYCGYIFNQYNLIEINSFIITLGTDQVQNFFAPDGCHYEVSTFSNNPQLVGVRIWDKNNNLLVNNSWRNQASGVKYYGWNCNTDGSRVYPCLTDSNHNIWAIPSGNIGPASPGYTSTWTSNTVNTSVFDGWSAAKVKIPASSWTPSDPTNWNVAEFLEELTVKLVAGNADQIVIEDDNPTPPVPIPSTPLGDIPTDEWYDLFGLPVLEGQEEIHQDLQDFNDSVSDGIDDVIGELEDIESDVESIDTNIGIGNGLLGDLKSIGQSIQSTLSSILSGVTDLVQEIVLSTETFIAGLLNSIIGGLGGMFSTMREAFSIWHYVVEWVGSISTVFSWFWSVAGSTSYYIQLPIYASIAGAVVLAFYKRFGK